MVLDLSAQVFREKAKTTAESESGPVFEESPAGLGKIRYIAGWCVSKLVKSRKSHVRQLLYKSAHKQFKI